MRRLLSLVLAVGWLGCVSPGPSPAEEETRADTSALGGTCGAGAADARELADGDRGIAIADDGTVYHAQSYGGERVITRTRPGAPIERPWLSLGLAYYGVNALAVAPNGTLYVLMTEGDGTGYQYTSWIEAIDATASIPTRVALGRPFASTEPTPNDITVSPSGELFVGGNFGLVRVDPSGRRTLIRAGIEISNLVHVGSSIFAITFDDGLVRLSPDGASMSVVDAFQTRRFHKVGVDALGRFYLTEHRWSPGGNYTDALVRFDAAFTHEEELFAHHSSVTLDFGDFAFGRGALACDVYITGWRQGHRVVGVGAIGGRS